MTAGKPSACAVGGFFVPVAAGWDDAQMSPIQIRRATPADIEPARAVLRAAYVEYEDAFPAGNWAPYLADILDLEGRAEASELIVAEADGAIAGCVSYFPPGAKAAYPSDAFSEHWVQEASSTWMEGVVAGDAALVGVDVDALAAQRALAPGNDVGELGHAHGSFWIAYAVRSSDFSQHNRRRAGRIRTAKAYPGQRTNMKTRRRTRSGNVPQ